MSSLIECGMVGIIQKYQEQNKELNEKVKELEKENQKLREELENDKRKY